MRSCLAEKYSKISIIWSPAYAAPCAVKLLLVFVIIELAVKAEVLKIKCYEEKRQSTKIKFYHLAKSEATFFTAFIHTLAVLAVTTLNRHHILPVDDLHEKHLF